MTVDEARAMILANDAEAIEEAANDWARPTVWGPDVRCGVDADGNVWITEDVKLDDGQLVAFVTDTVKAWN